MRVRVGKHREGKEGAYAAIPDGGACFSDGPDGSVVFGADVGHECEPDVGRVVDAQTDGQHEAHARDNVDGHIPVEHHATDVD